MPHPASFMPHPASFLLLRNEYHAHAPDDKARAVAGRFLRHTPNMVSNLPATTKDKTRHESLDHPRNTYELGGVLSTTECRAIQYLHTPNKNNCETTTKPPRSHKCVGKSTNTQILLRARKFQRIWLIVRARTLIISRAPNNRRTREYCSLRCHSSLTSVWLDPVCSSCLHSRSCSLSVPTLARVWL